MSHGRVYLLCFRDPETGQPTRYKHAGHYLGRAPDGRVDGRLAKHLAGQGAVLTAAARRAGLDFVVTRTWDGDGGKERQLKTRSGALYCPDCSEHPEPGTRPRVPGAKYLTRRQRERAARERAALSAAEAACRQDGGYGFAWPGQPSAACPGCERGGAHTSECDERERATARFLAETGVGKETGMTEPQAPLGPQPDPEDAGRLPLPRVLDASEVSPLPAPVAAALPDGTPHTDPFLAGLGWQARGGMYVRREAEREREAG